MRNILVIDDDPTRLTWFRDNLVTDDIVLLLVSKPEDGLEAMESAHYDALFLDHDLQSELDGSGILSKVLWNFEDYYIPPFVWAHSENPVGRENIVTKCGSFGIRSCSLSFGSFYKVPDQFMYILNSFLAQKKAP